MDLNESLSDNSNPSNRALAEISSRLSGIPMTVLYQADGMTRKSHTPDGQIIDEAFMRKAFEYSGVISAGVVNTVKVEELLKEKVEDKPETPSDTGTEKGE